MVIHTEASAIAPETALKPPIFTAYNCIVFALTLFLLMSDYMCRQLITAIFPILKTDWKLTDTQLGSLVSIVVLTVGLLTVPLSLLSDAFGRVRSIAVMAILWSVATLGCGLATSYGQMFAARLMMGVGEAAYASVGVAVLIGLFPARFRTTIIGVFMAGGTLGATLGLGLGGSIAAQFGWRTAFYGMAAVGVLLGLTYPLIVSDRRPGLSSVAVVRQSPSQAIARHTISSLFRELASTPTLLCAYLGGGLQLFVLASFNTWLPSYLNRAYGMSMRQAAVQASTFVLAGGIGIISCSALADQINRSRPSRKDDGSRILLPANCCLFGASVPCTARRPTIVPARLSNVLCGRGCWADCIDCYGRVTDLDPRHRLGLQRLGERLARFRTRSFRDRYDR